MRWCLFMLSLSICINSYWARNLQLGGFLKAHTTGRIFSFQNLNTTIPTQIFGTTMAFLISAAIVNLVGEGLEQRVLSYFLRPTALPIRYVDDVCDRGRVKFSHVETLQQHLNSIGSRSNSQLKGK